MSDLHGFLPEIPPCDLVLLAGDLCPPVPANVDFLDFQEKWLKTIFKKWLKELPTRKIIGIAGNHDLIFEKRQIPKLPWTYLQDSGIDWEGIKIWGTPWIPYFDGLAFNLDRPLLAVKWDLIPKKTDILITHVPPFGYGDAVNDPKMAIIMVSPTKDSRVGCPYLLKRIRKIKPKLAIFGHIHEGRGFWRLGNIILANVTTQDHFDYKWQSFSL